jgi:hypothetical protein
MRTHVLEEQLQQLALQVAAKTLVVAANEVETNELKAKLTAQVTSEQTFQQLVVISTIFHIFHVLTLVVVWSSQLDSNQLIIRDLETQLHQSKQLEQQAQDEVELERSLTQQKEKEAANLVRMLCEKEDEVQDLKERVCF